MPVPPHVEGEGVAGFGDGDGFGGGVEGGLDRVAGEVVGVGDGVVEVPGVVG